MTTTRLAKADVDGDIVDYQGRKLATKDRSTHTGTQLSSTISDLTEIVQDLVAAMIVAGANVTRTYDDTAGTLTITATGGGTGTLDTEGVQDAVAAMVVAGTLITKTYDDTAGTLTISTTATQNSTDAVLKARANHTGTQAADTITDTGTKVMMTAAERTRVAAAVQGVGVALVVSRTAAQGVPTAAQCAAAGYPDGTLITVDDA